MFIAAIDNSLDLLNILVADDEKVLAEQSITSPYVPSEIIAAAFSSAITDAGVRIADIQALFATLGPGSFTGIRVSLAFCKGISAANKIPLIGVPTLDVLAQPISHADGSFLCPIIDARKSEVFVSLYYTSKGELKRLTDYCAVKPETVPEIIRTPCICFGSGVKACEHFLDKQKGIKIERDAYQTIIPEAFIKTGLRIMNNFPAHDTKPIYGRKSEAEIKFNVTVD